MKSNDETVLLWWIRGRDIEDIKIVIKPYKCEECDSEFCEYWLWCKGKNVEDD